MYLCPDYVLSERFEIDQHTATEITEKSDLTLAEDEMKKEENHRARSTTNKKGRIRRNQNKEI